MTITMQSKKDNGKNRMKTTSMKIGKKLITLLVHGNKGRQWKIYWP